MTENEIKAYLRNRGWSKEVWESGSRYLFQRWHQFVSTVRDEAKTRNWLIDDYWIFLEIRDLIHEVGLDKEVQEEDKQFRALLTATDVRHQHKERNTTYDFWNCGYPKNASGFFYEQIKVHVLPNRKISSGSKS